MPATVRRKEREYKEVQEQEKPYPKTKREYKELVAHLAKQFGESKNVVDNTIKEKGLGYTIAVLQKRGRKEPWTTKLSKKIRSIFERVKPKGR
ncbi:MAG: hypothetical protein QXU93_07990 [Thermoproteus sp.]